MLIVMGMVCLIEDYENCSESKLWYYNLVSYIVFIISVSFGIKNCIFIESSIQENYKNRVNLFFHNNIFMLNLGLFIWGTIELFANSSKCEYYKENVWFMGLVNYIIQIISILVFLSITIYISHLYSNSKINNVQCVTKI
tara:strand:- start:862 stop:1281 length:420 start_codon:yes stop_codon:yes gene_type:complete